MKNFVIFVHVTWCLLIPYLGEPAIHHASSGQNSEAAYPASSKRLLLETQWGAHSLSGEKMATVCCGFSSALMECHALPCIYISRTGPGSTKQWTICFTDYHPNESHISSVLRLCIEHSLLIMPISVIISFTLSHHNRDKLLEINARNCAFETQSTLAQLVEQWIDNHRVQIHVLRVDIFR